MNSVQDILRLVLDLRNVVVCNYVGHVIMTQHIRNQTKLDPFCSQRFGSRSGYRFGNRFDRAEGAASFFNLFGF